jgi:hypothetical protein
MSPRASPTAGVSGASGATVGAAGARTAGFGAVPRVRGSGRTVGDDGGATDEARAGEARTATSGVVGRRVMPADPASGSARRLVRVVSAVSVPTCDLPDGHGLRDPVR